MLNLLKLLRRTVTSGASPSRVITINDYSFLEQAAAGSSVAMFLGGSFEWPTLQSELPKSELAKWKVSALPGPKPGETATGTGGWSIAALTHDPAKVAACASLIKEIYLAKGAEITGELPTSRSQFDKIKTLKQYPYSVFRRLLATGQPRPGLAVYPQLSSEMQIAIGSVLTGASQPAEALANAGDRVDQAYKLLSGGG
jgi:multiple sugar transport system substrate-binding protein